MNDERSVDIPGRLAMAAEEALTDFGDQIVFRQLRSTPESLVVHFSGYKLHQILQRDYPGRYRVAIEYGNRHDLVVLDLEDHSQFAFEFKIPWSNDLIVKKVANDFVKLLNIPNGFVVVVFLRMVDVPSWAGQRGNRYSTENFISKIHDELVYHHSAIANELCYIGQPIHLRTSEAEIESTVLIWRVGDAPHSGRLIANPVFTSPAFDERVPGMSDPKAPDMQIHHRRRDLRDTVAQIQTHLMGDEYTALRDSIAEAAHALARAAQRYPPRESFAMQQRYWDGRWERTSEQNPTLVEQLAALAKIRAHIEKAERNSQLYLEGDEFAEVRLAIANAFNTVIGLTGA